MLSSRLCLIAALYLLALKEGIWPLVAILVQLVFFLLITSFKAIGSAYVRKAGKLGYFMGKVKALFFTAVGDLIGL